MRLLIESNFWIWGCHLFGNSKGKACENGVQRCWFINFSNKINKYLKKQIASFSIAPVNNGK